MNVLVTGGAGYIGAHVIIELLKQKWAGEVVSVDTLERASNKNPAAGVRFVEGDIGNRRLMKELLTGHRIDLVVHLAGFIQVEESMTKPELYLKKNVAKGLALLEVMRESGVKKIIFSSSAAVYGNPSVVPIKESHKTNPINVYGLTKLFFEEMLEFYSTVYGFQSVALRYFNAAGASQGLHELHCPETHLIPRILTAISKGETFAVYGDDYKTFDGTCIRDFIHVEDIAKAHVDAHAYLEKNSSSFDVFNIGSGGGASILQVIDACKRVTGKTVRIKVEARRSGDPPVLVADYTKAKRVWGWKPRHSLSEIVADAWRSITEQKQNL